MGPWNAFKKTASVNICSLVALLWEVFLTDVASLFLPDAILGKHWP
jgi:hypothetical protein